jgi:protein O-GlcNAc transferase
MEADAAFHIAIAHHEASRFVAARDGYRAILARDPDHAGSLHLLGLIMVQAGEPEAGAKLIRRAMDLAPGRAPHHNSLGLALRALGRDEEAVRDFDTAAMLRPESAEIRNNLATTLRDLGRNEEAIAEYRRAVACGPEMAEIWYNLASTLACQAQGTDVEACFLRALQLRPDFVNALANYGRFLIGQARWTDAAAQLTQAVQLSPGDAPTWNNLGIARQELGCLAAAEANYRRAVALDPIFADAHYNLGCLLSGDVRVDEALACHASAVTADPSHGAARLAQCMAWLPVVYRSEAEVAVRRAGYLSSLDDLAEAVATPAVARAVAASVGTSQPFFLPYQGQNDREPQANYGNLVCRLAAEMDGPATMPPPPKPGERIRVGVVSGFFHDHTIFRLFLESWLTELDRDRFELTAFHTGRVSDTDTARAAGLCHRFVVGLPTVPAWMDAISTAAPHVLLYPEVGIDPVAGALAARRLARVQCVAWGHPETTGMPTMDYFLTAAGMEPPDGDAHYTEHLVRLPGIGVHYTPDQRGPPTERAALGLDPEVPVYWSGQALYKYLPRYDDVFPRIAAAVGRCQFVFIGFAKSAEVTAVFRARLVQAFAAFGLNADRYCIMLPSMPKEQFAAAVGAADVVLDTPGWSGGKSTLDCLAQNPAIVTLPGSFMRGRHTTVILREIGCEMTIADSLDDYVAIAIRLGLDVAWRTRVRKAVEIGKHRVFGDLAPVRALEQFLQQAVVEDAFARGSLSLQRIDTADPG